MQLVTLILLANIAQDHVNSSTEVNGHKRNVHIVVIVILTGHHDIQMAAIRGHLHLGHLPCHIHYLLVQPLLVPGKHGVVQQRSATGYAVCIQALLLEPLQELPQRDVASYGPAVPHGPGHVLVLDGLGWHRLRHGEEGDCEVCKCVPVVFNLVTPSEDFVKLQADKAGGHCGRGGDGWDDPSSYELCLQLVNFRDAVVPCPHVSKASYQVHMEIGVIILHIKELAQHSQSQDNSLISKYVA